MKKKKIISQICIHVILVALTAICLLPFLSMISTSFMKVKGVLPNEPILFPNFPLYLENYVKAWTANHFQTYFFNTLYVSAVGLIVNLLISITMAYSFSRFQFPGKEPIFNLLLLTMMIPAQLAMISQNPPFLKEYTGDPELIAAAEAACAEAGVKALVGKIATGDLFVGDSETKAAIEAKCAPDCVEMEGAAVSQIAAKNGVPCVILRAMSDNADEDGHEVLVVKKFSISEYVATATKIVAAMVEKL